MMAKTRTSLENDINWDEVDEVCSRQPRPAGTFTMKELAEHRKISRRAACDIMTDLLAKGKVEAVGTFGRARIYKVKK